MRIYKISTTVIHCNIEAFIYQFNLRLLTFKIINIHNETMNVTQVDINDDRHIGFLSLFSLFITRRESTCSITRSDKRNSPYRSILQFFAKSGSKMRYPVIVKDMSHDSLLRRGSSMLIKSHETSFFPSTFPSVIAAVVVPLEILVIGRRKDLTPTKRIKGVNEIRMGFSLVWDPA